LMGVPDFDAVKDVLFPSREFVRQHLLQEPRLRLVGGQDRQRRTIWLPVRPRPPSADTMNDCFGLRVVLPPLTSWSFLRLTISALNSTSHTGGSWQWSPSIAMGL
jgi:hypothetical protein